MACHRRRPLNLKTARVRVLRPGRSGRIPPAAARIQEHRAERGSDPPDAAGESQGPRPGTQVQGLRLTEGDDQWALSQSACVTSEGADSACRGAFSSPGGGDIHQALPKSSCKAGVARDSVWMKGKV